MDTLVYVDDLLITDDDECGIRSIKDALHQSFTIKDLGLARYFLGPEISRFSLSTNLHQRKYILDMIAELWII